jgi:hypothetical protein
LKRPIIYIIFCLFAQHVLAQGNGVPANPENFKDSISLRLNSYRTEEARNLAIDFAEIWSKFGPDNQQMIRSQYALLMERGYLSRPLTLSFFGAIVSAVNEERLEANKLTAWLNVAEQVILMEPANKVQEFFRASRIFFQHHALHYDRSYRLKIFDDSYNFDYIALPEIASFDEVDDNGWDNDNWDDDGWDNSWNDENTDDTTNQAPAWIFKTPQPTPFGAVIVFEKATLNFISASDSVFLRNTKGTYAFNEKLFIGEEGMFDWGSAGLSPDSVYTTFSEYNFHVAKPELKAQDVKLYYRGKLKSAAEGIFEFKSVARPKGKTSVFPHFMSYSSNIEIEGLSDKDLKYRGGFSLDGARIYTASVSRRPSVLEAYTEAAKKFRISALNFEFQDSAIISTNAAVAIYQGNDSISSPTVQVKFDRASRQLLLQPRKGVMRSVPYSSSFFNVDFSSEIIKWQIDSDSLNIFTSGGRSTVPLVLESVDYFDPEDFRLLAATGLGFHPVALVASYSKKFFTNYTNLDALARFSGKSIPDMHAAMEFLASKGLVYYNPNNGEVIIREKANKIFAAYQDESDYDNMKIHSVIDGQANASINFEKSRMTVRGVEGFKISDSLNVIIKPDNKTITLLQDRDVKFNGRISAGNFEVLGKDFTFKYDSFFISLNKIDSIRFFVTEVNAYGQTVRRLINNPMVGADSSAAAIGGFTEKSKSGGTLFIAKPNNKSGKSGAGNYPKLDATTGGVIYFNRKEVFNGVYDRSIYFVAPPFALDSLSDLDVGAIRFDGTFVSSGMFPNFKEKLHTMPDRSLGFDHQTPETGYQLFKQDAKFTGNIRLSNDGIRNTGRIDYLAASAESKDFIFYPDSVVGSGQFAQIRQEQFGTVMFPKAELSDFQMKWLPKQDRMIFKSTTKPFQFYDNTAQLDGTAIVTKQGVRGTGRLITRGSVAVSDELSFSAQDYTARHADFSINSDDPDKPILSGNDIRLKFDLNQNIADISPEIAGEAALEFPYAQFKTSIPNARWNLGEQTISMSKNPDVPIEDSYFYTTRKDLDSLSFNATEALYDIRKQELKVSGIPYITVADARITPENNEVLILANARIGTLYNTTIVLDTINAYHNLVDGVIIIESRKKFSGYATYRYVNALNDTFLIKMEDFKLEPLIADAGSRRRGVKASFQTVAKGYISSVDNVLISPGMYYKGDMIMYATKPALELKGYIKLDLKKINNYDTWITHQSTADQEEVIIDFDKATTEEGRRAEAGLHFAIDNSLYSTFITEKIHLEDEDFFRPSGSLFYAADKNEYVIEDLAKASGEKLSGKIFSYNENTSDFRFEGEVKFFNPLKGFGLVGSASGFGNLESSNIKLNSLVAVDMAVPSTAMDIMSADLKQVVKYDALPEGLGDRTELLYKVADIIGESAAKAYEQKSLSQYISLGEISSVTSKALVFADVNLVWSQEQKAFYSEGELGLSNSNRNDINGAMEGFMEIKRTEDGSPVYHVFVKASPTSWYYFGFEDNRLIIHSSNNDMNTVIAKRTNAGKAKVGELVFIPGSDDEVLAFVNRFRRQYYQISTPYSLRSEVRPGPERKKQDDDDDGF